MEKICEHFRGDVYRLRQSDILTTPNCILSCCGTISRKIFIEDRRNYSRSLSLSEKSVFFSVVAKGEYCICASVFAQFYYSNEILNIS